MTDRELVEIGLALGDVISILDKLRRKIASSLPDVEPESEEEQSDT